MYILLTKKKIDILRLSFAVLILAITGCSAEAGMDSLSKRKDGDFSQTAELGCGVCHSSALSNRRQVVGAGGDFDEESHHVIDYSNRNFEIITEDDCLVCHDQSSHMSGTVLLKNKDTSDALVYDPNNPATLETFCLSCHDSDGAAAEGLNAMSPFSSGNTLGTMPNSAGNKIKSYWENSDTVHKDNGLTCFGSGDPTTGCHGNGGQINAHGSASRGLLTKNMNFQLSLEPSSPYFDYNNYKLCFDCHDSYPAVSKEVVLGYKEDGNYDLSWAPTPYYTSSIQTLFRDKWTSGSEDYDDTIWADPYTPLHNYHLLGGTFDFSWLSWKYRGDTEQVGKITCTACHNVHGTGGSVRSTYDEFGITAFTNGPDEYKKMVPDDNYKDTVMMEYPINCAVSCHGMVGVATNYWHTPSGE